MKRSTKNRATKFVGSLLTGVLMASAAGPAQALTKFKVDLIRYENKGAYAATLSIIFKHIHTTKGTSLECIIWWGESNKDLIATDEHASFNLENPGNSWFQSDNNNNNCPDSPVEGSEVWMIIHIRVGETKNCRKDGTRYFYYSDGGTVKYVTKGTTYNNNRCKHHSPSDSYKF